MAKRRIVSKIISVVVFVSIVKQTYVYIVHNKMYVEFLLKYKMWSCKNRQCEEEGTPGNSETMQLELGFIHKKSMDYTCL
jgi:hypothetical protein